MSREARRGRFRAGECDEDDELDLRGLGDATSVLLDDHSRAMVLSKGMVLFFVVAGPRTKTSLVRRHTKARKLVVEREKRRRGRLKVCSATDDRILTRLLS